MTNTADSMIGYKSEKYLLFGFGAAKFDDLMNWIPSRICGTLMCAAYLSKSNFLRKMEDNFEKSYSCSIKLCVEY